MRAVDKLRAWSDVVPGSTYSWASLALTGPEVMELLGLVDGLEHRVAELEAAATPRRCSDCGRSARNLVAVADSGGVVYLGPQCYQQRRVRGAAAEALPIGGAW